MAALLKDWHNLGCSAFQLFRRFSQFFAGHALKLEYDLNSVSLDLFKAIPSDSGENQGVDVLKSQEQVGDMFPFLTNVDNFCLL